MGSVAEISSTTLTDLIALVRKHTGIVMTEKKSAMLQVRLRPRLRALSLDRYEAYIDLVERDCLEVQVFIDLVTTNDTVFFRTPHVWDFFSTEFLPGWWADHPRHVLKIWSAAAASGEEAYSIAMLCHEFRALHPGFEYQILATDISTNVLNMARAGIYSGRSAELIKTSYPELFGKYFRTHGNGVHIAAELKNRIRFGEHNLLQVLRPSDEFDLVFLRNVLIYFDDVNQEAVLNQTRKSMKDDARLILGESESISRIKSPFHYRSELVYSINAVATS